ncbi:methyltransferase family protein [Lacrimispora xylanolytica]
MTGFYQISRNPMYVGYFIFFLGCCVLTRSWLLVASLMVFQVSGHWIIRSEERWCIEKFGQEYTSYMDKVRRYI